MTRYHKFTRRLSFAVMGAAYGIGELGAPEWCWHPLLRLGSQLDRWRAMLAKARG